MPDILGALTKAILKIGDKKIGAGGLLLGSTVPIFIIEAMSLANRRLENE